MAFFVREKSFYKQFFTLTLTIALQNVIVYSVNLADNIMLGSYMQDAMSGVALVNKIQFILQSLMMGLAEGALMFASRSWGERDIPSIRKITNISTKCGLVISLAIFAAAITVPEFILSLLSPNAGEIAQGSAYLRIICFSYPLFAITQLLIYSMRSVETVKIGLWISVSTLIINVCLNYVLIYGNFGAPELGVRGAAIATLIARIVETLIVVIYVFFIDKKVKLRIKHFGKIDWTLFKSYVIKGAPVFFSSAIWSFAQAMQTAILSRSDPSAVTADSISSVVFQIVTVITYASASATCVVIGKAIGEGKLDMIKPYAKTLQVIFLCIGAFTGAVLFIVKDLIIGFYEATPEAADLARQFMIVLSITVIGTSYQMPCHTGIVRAGGDTSFILKVDTIFMWGIVLPASFIAMFFFKAPALVVFIILKCDQVLKCAIAAIKVNSFNYIKSLKVGEKSKVGEADGK